jgi:peptidylprolyl isomerase
MPAKSGDTVKVHYEGRLEDGTVFDSSREREPLLCTLGRGDLIAGFEAAVIGLETGDTATVTIAPEDAYGPHYAEAVDHVAIEHFGEGMPKVGEMISVLGDDGSQMAARIVAIDDELTTVTVDFNHPLAGATLTFDVELVEVVAPGEGS